MFSFFLSFNLLVLVPLLSSGRISISLFNLNDALVVLDESRSYSIEHRVHFKHISIHRNPSLCLSLIPGSAGDVSVFYLGYCERIKRKAAKIDTFA